MSRDKVCYWIEFQLLEDCVVQGVPDSEHVSEHDIGLYPMANLDFQNFNNLVSRYLKFPKMSNKNLYQVTPR